KVQINSFARAAADIQATHARMIEAVNQSLGARHVELTAGRQRRDEGGQDAVWRSKQRIVHGGAGATAGIGHDQPAVKPPSMYNTWPVMNAAAGDARKIAAPTRSSGVPRRRCGVLASPQVRIVSSAHNFRVRSEIGRASCRERV